MPDNYCAALILTGSKRAFEREKQTSPLQNGNLIQPSKSLFSQNSARFGWSTSSQPSMGFFFAAVMDATDNGLASGSFHVKTGQRPMPRRCAPLELIAGIEQARQAKAADQANHANRMRSSSALGSGHRMVMVEQAVER